MGNEKKPDDSEPSPERQAELRAAYDENLAAGKAPYAGVRIYTRGELSWVMRERDWAGLLKERANLSHSLLIGANLSGAFFAGANLSGGNLNEATLTGADLSLANLGSAHLARANLSGARLALLNLSSADLYQADLRGAHFNQVNLTGANLRATLMNVDTSLIGARLDARTRLGDVVWNSVPATRLNWEDVNKLGDEYEAWQTKDVEGKPKGKAVRLRDFQDAVLANRQVATLLRSQGLNEPADRFAYRAQVLQRQVLLRQRNYLRYLGSLFLGLIAGYGYRPLRSFATYLLVVFGFAAAYYLLGNNASPALDLHGAIVFSLTSFHGRGFSPGGSLSPDNPLTTLAAIEAVIGLLIEITFIATFTNRFFAR